MATLRSVATVAAALVASAAGTARADAPTPAFLSWVAPSTCPSESEVSSQILGAVGSGVTVPTGLHVRASVVEGTGRWRSDVEVSIAGQTSTRHVEGETCRAVADAVAVIVALAVTPDIESRSPPHAPLPSVAAAPEVLPTPVPPPHRERFEIGGAFMLDAGTLPSIGYGAELFAGFRASRLELEVSGRFLAPETADLLRVRPPEGATLWLAGFGARGCYALLAGRVDLAPCVGVDGEWLLASGHGTSHDGTATAPTGALALGGRLTAWLGRRLGLRLGLETEVPFLRTVFDITQAATPGLPLTVFRRSAVSGRAFIGPLVRF